MGTLTEIQNDPHFLQFASILQVAMTAEWRAHHSAVQPVRERFESLVKMLPDDSTKPLDKTSFLKAWTKLFVDLRNADSKLQYTDADMDWFAAVFDGKQTVVTLSMLFAFASTPLQWITLEQMAENTDDASSTLRKRAARGEIPGARIVGKTYIVPELLLRAYGIEIPSKAEKE